MHDMYQLLTGPLVWLSFIVFIGGSAYRFVSLYKLAKKKDGVVFEYMSLKFALRSIAHWLTPFATESMRKNPAMTVVTFAFHICLVILPIFVFAHVLMWKENFNISWITIPNQVADIMTLVVIVSCIFFLFRRIMMPEVKYLTTAVDYLILFIVAMPFISGYWAYHQWVGYPVMTLVHIFSGEVMLMAIPFTKLFHMFLFPFIRGYTGSEFGGVRMAKDW